MMSQKLLNAFNEQINNLTSKVEQHLKQMGMEW